MHLIKLHTGNGPVVVNMDLVTCFFPDSGGTKIFFPGGGVVQDFIHVTECYEEIMWAFDDAPYGNLEADKNG